MLIKKILISSMYLVMLFLIMTITVFSKTKIDVKSKIKDKIEATAAKNGIISSLKASSWAEVVEVGEDYSLWLKDYKRNFNNNNVSVTFVLELRTAAMFTDGKFISSEKVNITYSPSNEFKEEIKNNATNESTFLFELMQANEDDEMFIEALVIGERCQKIIKKLISKSK